MDRHSIDNKMLSMDDYVHIDGHDDYHVDDDDDDDVHVDYDDDHPSYPYLILVRLLFS